MDINISITENGVVTPQTVLLGRAGEHLVSKLIVSYPTTVNDIDISAISRYLNMGLKDGNVYTVPLVDISAGSSYVDLTSAMLAYSGKMQIMFTAHDAEPVGEPIFKSEIFFGLINRAIDGEDTIPEPVDNTGSVLLNNGSTWGVGAFEDSDTIEWTYDITTNSYTPSVIDGLYATAAQGALAETALQDATAFATAAQGTKADAALPATSYTADDVLTKLKTVDGTGSGLDADTLDGVDSTGFALSTHNHALVYAPILNGVTNGDLHDHNSGDGAQIAYANLSGLPTIPDELADLTDDATHRLVSDTEKSTWNGKQDALIADTDYLTPTTAGTTYEPLKDAGDLYVSSAEKSTWNAKQSALVADTDYLTPTTAGTTYEPKKGADDNYVTNAEKIVIGNTSGANTGDQDLSGLATKANVLEKDNTTAFTPTGDYNPTTKKYVDDAISGAGGYTDENAQDAVGGMLTDTNTIDFTYTDATPSITADVRTQNSTTVTLSADASGLKADVVNDSTHRFVTDTEKGTWNAKQDALTADTDYLTPTTAGTTYAPILKGVTNGDAHDHNGGDGAQIAYSSLSGTPSIPTQYTDEMAQDAVGGALANTASINLAYNDATPSISASANFGTTAGTVAEGNHAHTKAYANLYVSTLIMGLSLTSTSTWYPLLNSTQANIVEGFTHQNSRELKCNVAGTYLVNWNAVINQNDLNKPSAILGTVYNNGAGIATLCAQSRLYLINGSGTGNVNGLKNFGTTCILEFAVNDVITLAFKSSVADNSISIPYASLTLTRIDD